MRSNLLNNIIKRGLVGLSAIFMIINTNISGNFSYFDLVMVMILLFYTITSKSIKIKTRTFKVLVVLNVFLLLSLLPLLWTKQKVQSFLYFIQIVFAFNLIPLFIDRLMDLKYYNFFLKKVHQTIYVVGVLFIVFGILHFYFGQGEWLFFTLRGNHRLVWGDGFVGNDLSQFMVLGFLLNEYFISNKKKRVLMSLFLFFIFLFTLSRTVLLIGILYFLLRYTKKTLIYGMIVVFLSLIIVSTDISKQLNNSETRLGRLFEFQNSSSLKGGRIKSYSDVISNSVHFFISPLYGQMENFDSKELNQGIYKISSVHNIILSILVNFGLFPLLFLYVVVFIVFLYLVQKRQFYNFNTFIIFSILIFIIISINALMLSRALWMPIFIVLSFLDKNYKYNK